MPRSLPARFDDDLRVVSDGRRIGLTPSELIYIILSSEKDKKAPICDFGSSFRTAFMFFSTQHLKNVKASYSVQNWFRSSAVPRQSDLEISRSVMRLED